MDEAQFTQNGITNIRNSHSWAQENSQVTDATFNSDFHLTCGVEQ
jgi:hypothetical protein